MTELHVVVGGQFGSEGKGHVTAQLAKDLDPVAVIRVAGPNAGHTAYDANGKRWTLRQIPVAGAVHPTCALLLGPGSEIDPQVLMDEIDRLEAANLDPYDRIVVDPQATVIQRRHLDQEGHARLSARIGSTGKGIGAARADRLMRTAQTWADWVRSAAVPDELRALGGLRVGSTATAGWMHGAPARSQSDHVIIEGTQGYGLGLHAGYYPHCTSSDCTAVDFIAMAGLSPWMFDWVQVWPVFRTYPIRVAGNSGPLMNELDWADLAERTGGHVKPEHTTVTQKVRRVGGWDPYLARRAMLGNGYTKTAPTGAGFAPVLTFLDYVFPEIYQSDDPNEWPDEVHRYIKERTEDLGCAIAMVGTGPNTMITY